MRAAHLTAPSDIIDIDIDPLAERTRRRQTLLRIGLPLCGVGLIIGFLLGITVYADSANRAGVLGLSDTLLHTTQEHIALQVSAYLEPAAHATLLAQTMLGHGAVTDHADAAHDFGASVLAETPQIDNVLFSDAAGNFMLVTRSSGPTPGGTETKRILQSPSGRSVEWVSRDSNGTITARRQDPDDTYDARTRSWFIGARKSDHVFWTGVYVFFSERAPGVTAAVHGAGSDPDVVGVDIRLDTISKFLGELSIGRTGRAYIVANDGEMVAGPDAARILQTRDGKLTPARVDEIGDPNLVASWDHFRAQGRGERVIEVSGQRLISIVAPLGYNDQGWLLFITVPESEFSGFVRSNSRRAALLSLFVVGLAVGLAVLLVRQGLRADRAARAVAERSAAVRQQSAAFARLATEAGMFDAAGLPPQALTETLAEATGAKRAGIWRLSSGGQVLRCDDSFEPATGGHIGGLEVSSQEVPALIDALMAGEAIDAPDSEHDRRTTALHRSLLAPFGTKALFAVPIVQAGRTVGALLLEDARRDPAAQDLARACATLVALGIPVMHPSEVGQAAPLLDAKPSETVTDAPIDSVVDNEPAADDHGLDPALVADVGGERGQPKAVVLVLSLPEAAAPLMQRIASAAQQIATANGIPYLKMMGTTIIAAAGYSAQTGASLADAASRLANAAIALRDRCVAVFEETDGGPAFGLGLDVGIVLASILGGPPGLFNLWGEAVQGADALATSAPADAIQTSEQAYALLRQDFLFRPRGLFHRPRTGETRSYVLAGRA